MEAQIIRYRANRRFVFGILNIGELECFVMERRSSKLDAGSYQVTLSDYNNIVRIGDTVVTNDRFATTKGIMSVGNVIAGDKLQETKEIGEQLVKIIAQESIALGAVNLEIIDEADYDEADSQLA